MSASIMRQHVLRQYYSVTNDIKSELYRVSQKSSPQGFLPMSRTWLGFLIKFYIVIHSTNFKPKIVGDLHFSSPLSLPFLPPFPLKVGPFKSI